MVTFLEREGRHDKSQFNLGITELFGERVYIPKT